MYCCKGDGFNIGRRNLNLLGCQIYIQGPSWTAMCSEAEVKKFRLFCYIMYVFGGFKLGKHVLINPKYCVISQ